ncbi:tRNA dihydrouridine synthase DusB [Parasphaerochaeta coccoides]|uniref:tRNA-dihydrouridine synthase n=1 Tax=Parasphaerochaeta coccoides (strain ATCC BAA-1237 / DSM 17374 / SPN1) TaxID=760011 RepID=F4GLQ9_PARC1|nr:tRNA dihydrouridine synthase DusB [Parasphaerochaeta coccoides]AEC02453.1 TIM-barrel protein, nifR3 family [Parasphaerochaeta coccoides DSM 17374]
MTQQGKPLFHDVDIGNVHVSGNLFLAPLAGFTDLTFRSICSSHGASIACSEMVSAEGLARGSAGTEELLERYEGEEQFIIQIFGSETNQVERALPRLLCYKPTVIDFNCGCPVPKVVKTGAGSALMKHPQTIYAMVRAVRNQCDVPVSVKFRLGWDKDAISWREFAQAALEGGAQMLTMHARTRSQGYSGVADWSRIAALVDMVKQMSPNVPVFGSGDVFTPHDAQHMLEETGVDGVMFARGAIGNPFIFERTKALLLSGQEPEAVPLETIIGTIMRHLTLLAERKGEEAACRQMRGHAGSYLKGLPGSSRIRGLITQATTVEDYRKALDSMEHACQGDSHNA